MLLNAVIIVLREALEAGILISVLLTISRQADLSSRWLLIAMAGGLLGAALYAYFLGDISTWFDYVGQEVINAGLQFGLFFSLAGVCVLLSLRPPMVKTRHRQWLTALLAVAVILASIREGSEILVFFIGFLAQSDVFLKAMTSGFIGLMIGVSVGALCYYALMSLPQPVCRRVQLILLVLLAGGMVAQASQLLVQADWLPAAEPLWDSSRWLSESSLFGQLLYATFGYEASPTPVEVALYLAAIVSIPLLLLCVRNLPEK